MKYLSLFVFSSLCTVSVVYAGSVTKLGSVCTIHASSQLGADDAPAIVSAFSLCNHNAVIRFDDSIFHIESAMQTTGLHNVVVDMPGTTLLVSS